MSNNKIVISEPLLFSLLYFRKPRTLSLNQDTLKIDEAIFPVVEVTGIAVDQPWLIPKLLGGEVLRISTGDIDDFSTFSFHVGTKDASSLFEQIKRIVGEQLTLVLDRVEIFLEALIERHKLVYQPHVYVRNSIAQRFAETERNEFLMSVLHMRRISMHPMLGRAKKERASSMLEKLLSMDDHIRLPELIRGKHNQSYAAYWRDKEAAYFKMVERKPLTDEQIDTALVFEDATLVVAAAGSGKSSCIVGKIGFALKTGLFDETQILALAYNKKAAHDLRERLKEQLGKALNRRVSITSKTFHSFGLATLVAHYGKDYEPKVLKEDAGEEGRFIKKVISELVSGNSAFQNALALWMSLAPYDEPQPVGSSGDLDECAKRYEDCCRERLRARIAPGKKPWDPTIPTWRQNVLVRSLEERGIANWLILHDVDFEYEQRDWDGSKRLGLGTNANGSPKPYRPDFTYSYEEVLSNGQSRTVRVVHEHFALDENGRAPEWLGGVKYEEHAKSKRAMYRAWMAETPGYRERVVFLETTSAMMRNGSIWHHLEKSLRSAGVVVSKPSAAIQEQALEQFRETSNFEQLIIDFVLRYKDSGLSESDLQTEVAKTSNSYRSKLFLDVVLPVFYAYQDALKQAKKIDYADMLREAISVLADGRTQTPYRFILVDEFQDISKLNADLVKAVLAKNPDQSIVFCVGDDWQTINRFSGSDVGIFTNVSEYFGRFTSRLELTRTFRCSQGIADVAKYLVMLNPGQFNKEIKALPDQVSGAVRIVRHTDNAQERQNTLLAELNNIVAIAQDLNLKRASVQILRRTKKDTTAPEGIQADFLKRVLSDYEDILDIELHSMHGSKGLEADFVILPGLDSGFRGFPDQRPVEPLLDLVLPVLKNPVEEERRLMYVALTRARHMVSVLVSKRRPSEFIVQLESARQHFPAINWISCSDETRIDCPKCKSGSLVPARWLSSGLACSRTVGCGHVDRQRRSS